MKSVNLFKKSKNFSSILTRSALSTLLVFVSIFLPVIPVIQFPSNEDEGIKLGLEMNKAEAYGNGYTYRRSITINESQVTGSSDHTNFPVLMSFTETTFKHTSSGGNVTDLGGDDIIFTSDAAGNTRLKHEVERYTPTTGEITMWVKVPTLDFDNNTTVYMFYGNSNETLPTEDVANTWNSDYVGVWHMDDSGTTNSDSAGTANNGSVSGATAGAVGKFGPAYDFDGVNDVSTVTDHADLDITNAGTIEAWFKTDDTNGSESNFSDWVSRDTPIGGGADDQSGFDSVIVGENIHYGAILCNDTTEDIAVASSTLSGTMFNSWDATTFGVVDGCGASEGGVIGMDSDGVYIYYAALAVSASTPQFWTASATPTFSSVSAWRNESDPTGTGDGEGNGIDMVIVGNTIYYDSILLTTFTENFASTSRAIGSADALTWTAINSLQFGGGTDENCSNGVDSDGDRLYRMIYCHNGATVTYSMSSSTLAGVPSWNAQANVPSGSGGSSFDDADVATMGGRIFHSVALHDSATESYSTASSSMASGGTLTWVSRQDGSGNPDGTSLTNSIGVSVASDGKNVYYSAMASTTAGDFFTASSTLPAHPFVSKRNAYEVIQVGQGLAFDWAGRPYTFGTSTDTTGFDHIVITQDGTTLSMYENGVLRRTQTTSVDFESNANNLLIGGGTRSDGTSIYFDGIIDEVRISSSARSADWILTGYNNQNSTSTFYTLGAQEESTTIATVTTNFATPGATSAVLNGTKTAGDNATQHGFAYSTDSTLTTGVSTTTLGALNSNSSFQSAVSSLDADTPYYFRAYVTNGAGTGYGTIKSFTTGNSTAKRRLRLFDGAKVKFISGRVILNQE